MSARHWAGVLGMAAAFLTPAAARAQGVSVGGVGYAQYVYDLSDSASFNEFALTRAYVNVTGRFDHGIATRITTDLYRADNGSYNVRIKYGYVAWTPEKSPLTLKFGQIQTPWLDWQEHLWGYRMQGTMALDRAGYLTASDLGFGVDGSFSDGVNFQASVVNGEGYHGAEGDSHKDAEARVSVRLLPTDLGGDQGGLRLTGYAGVGAPTGGGVRDRFVGELSYKAEALTLAGEYALVRNRTGDETATNPTAEGDVFGAFGVLSLPRSPVQLIARVDRVNPDRDVADDERTIVIGGVAYRVSPNLRVLADIDHIGYAGTPSPLQDAARNQALFQIEFTF